MLPDFFHIVHSHGPNLSKSNPCGLVNIVVPFMAFYFYFFLASFFHLFIPGSVSCRYKIEDITRGDLFYFVLRKDRWLIG